MLVPQCMCVDYDDEGDSKKLLIYPKKVLHNDSEFSTMLGFPLK